MASSKEYLQFVLEQLSNLDGITHRAMMGEYIIYYNGKVVGGIYDDRFLLKQTKSSVKLLSDAPLEKPYDGAKEMLLADVDSRELLETVIPQIADDLPDRKK
ncbi:MAG: TfoX/Sxy family protein [Eubacterium sp.]|nr:TfoX/Sxy family protein [Eubacterium sp.]MBR2278871.1 TfoX/Sxy family protein [Eubacterium sp.]